MDRNLLLFTFLSVFAATSVCHQPHHFFTGDRIKNLDFVASSVFNGRKTVRIAHGGILGLESFVDSGNKQRGLFIREVTDGKHLVKMVYSDADTLLNCDLLKDDPEEIFQFLKHFLSKDRVHREDLEQEALHRHLCRHGNGTWNAFSGDNMEGYGEEEYYLRMTDIKALRKECRDFYQSETEKIKELKSRQQKTDVGGKSREKRQAQLIYPGTKWCGKGTLSTDYEDLGDMRDTDKCCRTHDMCPYYIEGMSRKYGYYNFGISTLVHCECDERFRTCLKFQNNPVSENMGEIFFNRLATKCFVFKSVQVCAKKSFWGRCTEYKHEYQAEILEPLEY